MNRIGSVLASARQAVLAIRRFGLGRYIVDGWSMWPALRPGDRLLILRGTYGRRLPRRGDLVLARPAALNGRPVLKRVAAVIRAGGAARAARVMLLGDNPEASTDSRQFGAVGLSEIHGRVLLRYWPEARRGRVR